MNNWICLLQGLGLNVIGGVGVFYMWGYSSDLIIPANINCGGNHGYKLVKNRKINNKIISKNFFDALVYNTKEWVKKKYLSLLTMKFFELNIF